MAQPSPTVLLLTGLALGLSACGGAGGKYANRPGRAPPTVVAAAITSSGVNLSPDHFGAGLVQVIVSNQTATSQQLILQSSGGAAFQQQTAPINPDGTAELKAQLGAGRYTVGVEGPGVKAATLAVGARSSSPSRLLLP